MARHPIYEAVFDAWWLQHGVDPRWVRQLAEGKAVTPRAFAEAIRKEFGIPLGTWKKLEPQYSLQRRRLPSRTHHVTITPTMEAPTGSPPTAVAVRPRRRSGPPLISNGPFSIASRNSGKSMFEIAAALGLTYNAAKASNRRRSAQQWVRTVLAAPPYNVPDSAYAS